MRVRDAAKSELATLETTAALRCTLEFELVEPYRIPRRIACAYRVAIHVSSRGLRFPFVLYEAPVRLISSGSLFSTLRFIPCGSVHLGVLATRVHTACNHRYCATNVYR